MNKRDIDRLGYLLSLSSETEALKEKARQAAGGEKASFVGDAYVITVSNPGKTAPRLNMREWKLKAPREYADVFRRHHTEAGTKSPSVTGSPIVKGTNI